MHCRIDCDNQYNPILNVFEFNIEYHHSFLYMVVLHIAFKRNADMSVYLINQ